MGSAAASHVRRADGTDEIAASGQARTVRRSSAVCRLSAARLCRGPRSVV